MQDGIDKTRMTISMMHWKFHDNLAKEENKKKSEKNI